MPGRSAERRAAKNGCELRGALLGSVVDSVKPVGLIGNIDMGDDYRIGRSLEHNSVRVGCRAKR